MKKVVFGICSILISSAMLGAEIDLGTQNIYSETGFETSLRSSVSSPYIVTSKEIKEKHYTRVSEILRDIPHIYIGPGGSVDMRGQGSAHARTTVQLLIDGVPANFLDTSHINLPIDTLNPEDIKRIEVIPGGGAVLYGSGTSGGVINIITKKYTGNYAKASYQIGSYHNHKYDVAAGTSLGNFDINLSYSKNNKDGYRKKAFSDSDFFSGKLRYHFNPTDSLEFKYSYFDNKFRGVKSLTREQVEKDRRQSGLSPEDNLKNTIRKEEWNLTYDAKWTSWLEHKSNLFYQSTEIKSSEYEDALPFYQYQISSYQKMLTMPGIPPMMQAQLKKQIKALQNLITSNPRMELHQGSRFKDQKFGFKMKNKFKYGENSDFILGLGYIHNKMDRDSWAYTKNTQTNQTIATLTNTKIPLNKKTFEIFGLNTYRHNNWEFVQGLRFEKAKYNGKRQYKNLEYPLKDRSMNNVAANLAVNYLYSDTGNVYVKYERGFTSPAPAQLMDKIRKGGVNDYVNNDLKSEKSNSFEVGWNDYLFHSLVSADVFFSETKDEISTIFSGGHGTTFSNLNLGQTKRYGFDLKASQVFEKWTFSEAYSYIHAKIMKDKTKAYEGKYISYVPRHKFSLNADYAITPKWTLGGEYQYSSSVYLDNANKNGKDGARSVFNLQTSYEFNSHFSIYAGIKNVLNHKYYESVSAGSSQKYYSPAPERNYYAGFRYQF